MKQIKYLGLVFLFLLIVAGCGKTNGEEETKKGTSSDQVEETENQDETTDKPENKSESESVTDENEENKEPEAVKEVDTDFDNAQNQKATSDEDLNLVDILGSAKANQDELYYEKGKDYYVLELYAGLSNYNSQTLKNKWVAFALPNGVEVAQVDAIPRGIVVVSLPDGHKGIAVKIPDLNGISSENVKLEIPLIGEPNDNDPNENLYLFNVENGDQKKASLVGQISSTREIDFSVMEDK